MEPRKVIVKSRILKDPPKNQQTGLDQLGVQKEQRYIKRFYRLFYPQTLINQKTFKKNLQQAFSDQYGQQKQFKQLDQIFNTNHSRNQSKSNIHEQQKKSAIIQKSKQIKTSQQPNQSNIIIEEIITVIFVDGVNPTFCREAINKLQPLEQKYFIFQCLPQLLYRKEKKQSINPAVNVPDKVITINISEIFSSLIATKMSMGPKVVQPNQKINQFQNKLFYKVGIFLQFFQDNYPFVQEKIFNVIDKSSYVIRKQKSTKQKEESRQPPKQQQIKVLKKLNIYIPKTNQVKKNYQEKKWSLDLQQLNQNISYPFKVGKKLNRLYLDIIKYDSKRKILFNQGINFKIQLYQEQKINNFPQYYQSVSGYKSLDSKSYLRSNYKSLDRKSQHQNKNPQGDKASQNEFVQTIILTDDAKRIYQIYQKKERQKRSNIAFVSNNILDIIQYIYGRYIMISFPVNPNPPSNAQNINLYKHQKIRVFFDQRAWKYKQDIQKLIKKYSLVFNQFVFRKMNNLSQLEQDLILGSKFDYFYLIINTKDNKYFIPTIIYRLKQILFGLQLNKTPKKNFKIIVLNQLYVHRDPQQFCLDYSTSRNKIIHGTYPESSLLQLVRDHFQHFQVVQHLPTQIIQPNKKIPAIIIDQSCFDWFYFLQKNNGRNEYAFIISNPQSELMEHKYFYQKTFEKLLELVESYYKDYLQFWYITQSLQLFVDQQTDLIKEEYRNHFQKYNISIIFHNKTNKMINNDALKYILISHQNRKELQSFIKNPRKRQYYQFPPSLSTVFVRSKPIIAISNKYAKYMHRSSNIETLKWVSDLNGQVLIIKDLQAIYSLANYSQVIFWIIDIFQFDYHLITPIEEYKKTLIKHTILEFLEDQSIRKLFRFLPNQQLTKLDEQLNNKNTSRQRIQYYKILKLKSLISQQLFNQFSQSLYLKFKDSEEMRLLQELISDKIKSIQNLRKTPNLYFILFQPIQQEFYQNQQQQARGITFDKYRVSFRMLSNPQVLFYAFNVRQIQKTLRNLRYQMKYGSRKLQEIHKQQFFYVYVNQKLQKALKDQKQGIYHFQHNHSKQLKLIQAKQEAIYVKERYGNQINQVKTQIKKYVKQNKKGHHLIVINSEQLERIIIKYWLDLQKNYQEYKYFYDNIQIIVCTKESRQFGFQLRLTPARTYQKNKMENDYKKIENKAQLFVTDQQQQCVFFLNKLLENRYDKAFDNMVYNQYRYEHQENMFKKKLIIWYPFDLQPSNKIQFIQKLNPKVQVQRSTTNIFSQLINGINQNNIKGNFIIMRQKQYKSLCQKLKKILPQLYYRQDYRAWLQLLRQFFNHNFIIIQQQIKSFQQLPQEIISSKNYFVGKQQQIIWFLKKLPKLFDYIQLPPINTPMIAYNQFKNVVKYSQILRIKNEFALSKLTLHPTYLERKKRTKKKPKPIDLFLPVYICPYCHNYFRDHSPFFIDIRQGTLDNAVSIEFQIQYQQNSMWINPQKPFYWNLVSKYLILVSNEKSHLLKNMRQIFTDEKICEMRRLQDDQKMAELTIEENLHILHQMLIIVCSKKEYRKFKKHVDLSPRCIIVMQSTTEFDQIEVLSQNYHKYLLCRGPKTYQFLEYRIGRNMQIKERYKILHYKQKYKGIALSRQFQIYQKIKYQQNRELFEKLITNYKDCENYKIYMTIQGENSILIIPQIFFVYCKPKYNQSGYQQKFIRLYNRQRERKSIIRRQVLRQGAIGVGHDLSKIKVQLIEYDQLKEKLKQQFNVCYVIIDRAFQNDITCIKYAYEHAFFWLDIQRQLER